MLDEISASEDGGRHRLHDASDPAFVSLDRAALVLRGRTPHDLLPALNEALSRRYARLPARRLFRDLLDPLKKSVGNAYKRGNLEDPTKWISVEAVVTSVGAVVSVSDEGQGFDVGGLHRNFQAGAQYYEHHGSGFRHFQKARSTISYTDGGRTFLLRFLAEGKPGLPDDPALPALEAIRAAGLAGALPAMGLDGPVELRLRSYTPAERVTLEARAGPRRFAVKAYAQDPTPEAELYQALAAAGLAGDAGVRVPPLLAWDRDLRLLVIGWLEGRTAKELVEDGQGARAGELAAGWVRRAASLPVRLGPPLGAAHMIRRVRRWIARLEVADPHLGAAARAEGEVLARTQPREGAPRLVHGALHARRVLDLVDGPAVIGWRGFGQGPAELDAGVFLATTTKLALSDDALAMQVARAEEAFLAGTAGLLDPQALAWYRAAMLVGLARKRARKPGDWRAEAAALLREAAGTTFSSSGVDLWTP